MTNLWAVRRARLAGLVGLTAIAAGIETISLVLLAVTATSIADGSGRAALEVAFVNVDVRPSVAVGVATMAIVVSTALRLVVAHFQTKTVEEWERRHRRALADAVLGAGWPAQQRWSASEAVEAFGHTVTVAANGLNARIALINAVTTLVVLVGVAFVVHPTAALMILALGGALMIGLRPFNRAVHRSSERMLSAKKEHAAGVGEVMELSREVKIFGAASWAATELDRASAEVSSQRQRTTFLSSVTPNLYRAAGLLFIAVLLATLSTIDRPDLATLGSTAFLLLRSVSSGQSAQGAYQRMVQGRTHVVDILGIIRSLESERVGVGGADVGPIGTLDLDRVSYDYEAGARALTDIDLRFHKGTSVGIVGPSGSGKSTLAQLILRLREPTVGQVLVDGRPVRQVSLASWHRAVAFVPQVPRLMRATVHDNIAFWRHSVSPEDVVAAARAAGLHETIASLPDGYHTELSPETRDLSGGQLQRLGIARALADRPQVLVLDEPTSALDAYSEETVETMIANLAGSTLVVVIAHRMSTVRGCDRIVVLGDGCVQADGSFDEVLAANAFFEYAWARGRSA